MGVHINLHHLLQESQKEVDFMRSYAFQNAADLEAACVHDFGVGSRVLLVEEAADIVCHHHDNIVVGLRNL